MKKLIQNLPESKQFTLNGEIVCACFSSTTPMQIHAMYRESLEHMAFIVPQKQPETTDAAIPESNMFSLMYPPYSPTVEENTYQYFRSMMDIPEGVFGILPVYVMVCTEQPIRGFLAIVGRKIVAVDREKTPVS